MSSSTHPLPHQTDGLFLTDGGLETTLIFHEGFDLPHFAAFHLLRDDDGSRALRRYFSRYAGIARDNGLGFVLESATWRASTDWGQRLGYSPRELDEANRRAVELLHEIRTAFETRSSPMAISGCVGPRGDGYDPGAVMHPQEAQEYHARQIDVLAASGVDLVSAITMTNSSEAIGVTRAAQAAGVPAVISFTVETDGRLPTGESLGEAIQAVDGATAPGPAYFMINCAHPTHFEGELTAGGKWLERVRGIRANASQRSHAELDAAEDLDAGDPVELGRRCAALRRRWRHINVLGGCCGTDHRHIERICEACAA